MALAFTNAASSPGNDVCTQDDAKPVAQRKKFPVQDYVDYFTGLGRPFSGAFIYSADPTSCTPDASGNIVCTPGLCSCQCPPSCASCGPSASGACQIASDCSGKASGNRFHDTSAGLRAKGVQTLDGSVCDWNFGKTLQGIAELVKPPAGLTLPTPPAAGQVTTLLIESADGKSSRTCNGPGTNLDWYFVDCKTNAPLTAGTSTCILINHDTGNCEPNPGETYVAQYLGLVPTPSLSNPSGGCAAVSDCVTALGGEAQDWSCTASGSTRGTCLCATP